ncbi:hypothetical protein AX16_000218 [Volvariella volvacea WC 439]|nr:hypothetical protein AX16_000218 [Volvariella volvacea WC 439]
MSTPEASAKSSSHNPGPNVPPTSRWNRSNDSGSAFSRGKPRGRGRGGASRNGHVGNSTRGPNPSISITSISHNDNAKSSPVNSSKGTSPIVPPTENSPISSIPKPSSRSKNVSRNSPRSNPPVNTTTPVDVPPTPRSRNKKRRLHSTKASSSSRPTLPSDDNLLHPPKPTYTKDTPPHLASLDLRNNIDALVERVRAVAMAEHRPSTPGSHIDWAGDDDDSLPDLDDWGITTSKSNLMSPIFVDGLTSLPDHAAPPNLLPSTERIVSGGHPSIEPNLMDSQQPQAPANSSPTHDKEPHKALPNDSISEPEEPQHSASIPVEEARAPSPQNVEAIHQADGTSSPNSPTFSGKGLHESIHAPQPEQRAQEGLESSMHAPKNLSDSRSAPSLNSPPSWARPRPNSKHVRAHTVGKTPEYIPDLDRVGGRHSRFGLHSPRGALRQNLHTRTHSSPPTHGQAQTRSRPILTGDALSRLAKTIGATAKPSTSTALNTDT